jgi:hypothetical protein
LPEKATIMDNGYWIDRKRAAMTMARRATTSEARLIHYQMAGLYSIKAAHSPAFLAAATLAAEKRQDALRPTTMAAQPFDREDQDPAGEPAA